MVSTQVGTAVYFPLSPVPRGEGWGEGPAETVSGMAPRMARLRRPQFGRKLGKSPSPCPSPLSTGERGLERPPDLCRNNWREPWGPSARFFSSFSPAQPRQGRKNRTVPRDAGASGGCRDSFAAPGICAGSGLWAKRRSRRAPRTAGLPGGVPPPPRPEGVAGLVANAGDAAAAAAEFEAPRPALAQGTHRAAGILSTSAAEGGLNVSPGAGGRRPVRALPWASAGRRVQKARHSLRKRGLAHHGAATPSCERRVPLRRVAPGSAASPL
jgi:hypothetical protein